jgi:peroxiredoxin
MPIHVGDHLPQGVFKVKTEDGTKDVTADDYFAGKTVVLFGVPGAFTPTCHRNHLPGFIDNAETIKARGADAIAVVAVNDHHVMKAWAEATGGAGKIDFLADGSAKFVKAIGLDADRTEDGMGTRAVRFSMIVKDGVVSELNVEDVPGKVTNSGAATIMEQLDGK